MSSSEANANHPRIPGRCDICDLKDGKRNMNFVQCSKCKMCIHRECYMVYPEDDVDDFVCYACAAVGRTYEAVETRMSRCFFEIEQKERPVECALCSVSDGLHAMVPLFDYHGQGGRQICVTKGTKTNDGNKNERVLVWAHALCAFYLSSVGFMYACYKDGDYIGMEEDEDDTDPRPSNPELTVTEEFKKMYGNDSMPHFRYYMTPPNGRLDAWTKSIQENKRTLKCIECGLSDDKKTMRIPLQCVANDPDEFSEHKNKHMERNNDVAPCTQALHVGCARWGDPSSKLRKVYYFPGHTNSEGSIVGNVDTVHCLYCKTHAENVDETHQKLVRKEKALLKKRKAAEKERLEQQQQCTIVPPVRFQIANSVGKNRSQHQPSVSTPLPSFSNYPKRPVSMIKGTKSAAKRAPVPTSNITRTWGKYKSRDQDRYKELNPSVAVAINAGQQPTLAKRRREIANSRSVVTQEDMIQIFDDLVSHRDEIAQNNSVLNGRKRHWKHEFLALSTTDFDSIWIKARKKFNEYQNKKANLDSSKSSTPTGIKSDPDFDSTSSVRTEDGIVGINPKKMGSRNKSKNVERKNNLSSSDDSDMEMDFSTTTSKEMTTFDDGNDNENSNQKSSKKPKKKRTGERPPDRWSKLFIGQPFEMGHEFTLDEF